MWNKAQSQKSSTSSTETTPSATATTATSATTTPEKTTTYQPLQWWRSTALSVLSAIVIILIIGWIGLKIITGIVDFGRKNLSSHGQYNNYTGQKKVVKMDQEKLIWDSTLETGKIVTVKSGITVQSGEYQWRIVGNTCMLQTRLQIDSPTQSARWVNVNLDSTNYRDYSSTYSGELQIKGGNKACKIKIYEL